MLEFLLYELKSRILMPAGKPLKLVNSSQNCSDQCLDVVLIASLLNVVTKQTTSEEQSHGDLH